MVRSRRLLDVVIVAVAAQRLAELVWSRRNERRLRARGAVEHGAEHYPWMVAVHVGWLASTVIEGRRSSRLHPVAFGLFLAAQPVRLWVLATLRDRWTTRVLTVPDEPLVTSGPYRVVRHPNYLVVVAEIASLPLAFGARRTAALASVANAAVLRRRIRIENEALHLLAETPPARHR